MPFAELGERRVYYEEHGEGDPVLLVNGLTADHTAWDLQTSYLRERFRVVVFDNPGVGQTEGPGGPYTSALFAEVAAALLDDLGIAAAHVVGASMGGIIAQELALHRPDLVRSLVLHCTWGRADAYLTQLIHSWETYADAVPPLDLSRQVWLWVFTPDYLADEENVKALERGVREHPHPQSPLAFSDQAAACVSHDALDRVGEIRAPTLIAVGDSDLLAPPRHSLALKERMPHALLHVWPRMGHAPFWEIPDEFNELNRVFLEAN